MYGRGHQGGGGLGFGPPVTPPIIKQLLIANIAIYLAQMLIPALSAFGAIVPYRFWEQGWLWQPLTYMWMHSEYSLMHILMNMFVLWMFGSQLAMAWGPKTFLRYYLICGVGAGLVIATLPYVLFHMGAVPERELGFHTVGASGAIYGVMLAYSLTWPDRTIMLIFPPVAFRAIWLIPILFAIAMMFPGSNISHTGHLGGVLVGWIYMRRTGSTGRLFSLQQIKYRWRRYRMRRKLRAVQYEEYEARRREQDKRFH